MLSKPPREIRARHDATEDRRRWACTVPKDDGEKAHLDRGELIGMIEERDRRIEGIVEEAVARGRRIAELERQLADTKFASRLNADEIAEYEQESEAVSKHNAELEKTLSSKEERIAELERENDELRTKASKSECEVKP